MVYVVSITEQNRQTRRGFNRGDCLRLVIAGVAGYAVAQGLQFVGLYYLPAITVTFLLNFTPVFVTVLGIVFLNERPTKIQVTGMTVALAGAYLYFLTPISGSQIVGVLITLVSGLGWAIYMIMIRNFQRVDTLSTSTLTATTMSIGAAVLIISASTLEGIPNIDSSGWAIIIWLSVINTALAFYIWNHTLRRIRAYELSILQNTMLVQIAVLAVLFLGEGLTINNVVGIVLVLTGVMLVQLHGTR